MIFVSLILLQLSLPFEGNALTQYSSEFTSGRFCKPIEISMQDTTDVARAYVSHILATDPAVEFLLCESGMDKIRIDSMEPLSTRNGQILKISLHREFRRSTGIKNDLPEKANGKLYLKSRSNSFRGSQYIPSWTLDPSIDDFVRFYSRCDIFLNF